MLRKIALFTAVAAFSVSNVYAGADEAKKWIDEEFQPSTLSKEEQMKEMEWFINAAKPFVGMEINVLSETIPTHEYESKTLAKAFEEITGIKVNHDLIGEGDVVEKLQTQMQSGILYGLSAAVMGEISFREGRVVQSNFHDYGALRLAQCVGKQNTGSFLVPI